MRGDHASTNRLLTAIEAVMYGARPERRKLAGLLRGLSGVYGALLQGRRLCRERWRTAQRLPCRVVSVGNLTLGGTGKTPMTIYMAQLLHHAGCRTAVVSRGYKGAAEAGGGVVSDGRRLLMGPGHAGDEPFLMARELLSAGIPVLVGRNRVRSGRLAVERFQCDMLILDDGFQHLRLARDLNLVLLDAARPFGNGFLLPRGTLREPPASLSRADACLLTRCPPSAVVRSAAFPGTGSIEQMAHRRRRPVFPAVHRPYVAERLPADRANRRAASTAVSDLRGPVFAFSGIARNRDFRTGLRDLGVALRGWADFADHHAYTAEDLKAIAARAQSSGARLLATTQKDRVKIDPGWLRGLPLAVIGVRIELGDYASAFERFVCSCLDLRCPSGE